MYRTKLRKRKIREAHGDLSAGVRAGTMYAFSPLPDLCFQSATCQECVLEGGCIEVSSFKTLRANAKIIPSAVIVVYDVVGLLNADFSYASRRGGPYT